MFVDCRHMQSIASDSRDKAGSFSLAGKEVLWIAAAASRWEGEDKKQKEKQPVLVFFHGGRK